MSPLGDFVLGGVDGVITTVAVVAGSAGGRLSIATVIILGLANLVADGFSMGISNYLGTRSRQEETARARADESWHRYLSRGERLEVRAIFARTGFTGDLLDRAVEVVTADREKWLDTMMEQELMLSEVAARPLRAGLTTFGGFAPCGFIPLLPFIIGLGAINPLFRISLALSAVTFVLLGAGKGWVLGRPLVRSGSQTLLIGSVAAPLAYGAGAVLAQLLTA